MVKTTSAMQSRITKEILKKAEPVANTRQHIIIIGEYGSGKSWLAKKIHETSNRGDEPFIHINCYALDPAEAQKKIFGYLQFTDDGAKINKGFFEKSNNGTLFLDGFDAFSKHLQKKILNSVESHKANHIGSSNKIPLNIRTILSIDVKSYYDSQLKFGYFSNLINIESHTIRYPPLRQRREEIEEIIQTFLKTDLSQRYDFAATEISPKAMYLCIRYSWPGNVQQLKNAIVHSAIISSGDTIQPEHLPNSVKQNQPNQEKLEYLEQTYTYRLAEKQLIKNVLNRSLSPEENRKTLGLSKERFQKKLKDYQIEIELT